MSIYVQASLFDLLVPPGYEVIYRRRVRKKNGGWIYPKKGRFLRLIVKKRPTN
jgi:hypothetical protein